MMNFARKLKQNSRNGIKILKGTQVKSIQGDDSVKSVKLADGTEIKADMVILAIGAKPNTELAKKAGLELGYQGAIKTDRRMQSYNDPDVFACGDARRNIHSFLVRLYPPCWHLLQPLRLALQDPTYILPPIRISEPSASFRLLLMDERSPWQG
jgi:NADPH-dependent 2,4-dienoyl-CoA reductase/sulfur reductase-like enzyme